MVINLLPAHLVRTNDSGLLNLVRLRLRRFNVLDIIADIRFHRIRSPLKKFS